MAQNTNLNIAPYFDDFDSDKGFLKVLFKPGYPVQARELTTLQSILQNQIDSFGQGVYKDGSMVIPGGITLNTELPVVLIQNTYLNLDVELYRKELDGKVLKGSTSGVRARVAFSISAATSERGNISFYVTYLQKADDNVTSTFTNGEILTCEDDITYQSTTISAGTPIAQLLNSNSSSVGSTANIGRGVYFVRGYFVPVLEQTIILDQYGVTPSYKVGLKVEERLITADEDETLYDNAIGSTNFSAPGADRFKINLTLVKKQLTDPNSADFIELLRTDVGKIEKKVVRSDLGFINEVLANRTKEESGDYYVKKFSVDVRENLDDGFNNGVFTTGGVTQDGNTPSEDNMAIQLSPGIAYISGFRTERQSTSYKDVEKPRTFVGQDNVAVTAAFGNYIFVDTAYKSPSLYSTLELRDQVISTNGSASGTLIGYTRVYGFSYEDGDRDTTTTQYRINIADTTIFTKVTTNSVTWTAGDLLVGATSGAKGFVQAGSGTTGYLYDVTGTFVAGEILRKNGSTFATTSAVYSYNFSDVKSVYASGFTANLVLDSQVALPGSGPILSGVSGATATVTATLSNYVSQLRINDIIEFSNNNASHKARVTAITSNYVFTISRLGSTTLANGAITSAIIRTRPEIKESNRRALLAPLGQQAVKNTNKNNTIAPSGFFRQSYSGIGVSSGSFSITAGTGLTFRDATDADDFIVIVDAGGGTMPTGTIITYGGSPTFTVSAAGSQSSVTISALDNAVTSVSVIATVFQSDRSAKVKTTERMKILKLDDTIGSAINGLTTVTTGYGSRVEDDVISLGCADVFKIKAIYESLDSSDPVLPRFQYTNLVGTLQVDEIITGDISGSRARVITTDSNYVYFIPVNDDRFTDGENISGPTATLKIVTGSILAGSKNITDNYTLDNGQRDQYYDYSRLVRKPGYTAPTHRVFVIFDRFLTTSGTGFYSVDSYPDSEYKEIPSYGDLQLRNCLDFRPIVPSNLSGSGSRVSPYTLTSGGKLDFGNRVFTGNLVGLPGQSDSTILSYEYYLGRIDKVFLNKDNAIQIVKGSPSDRLVAPEDIEDAMLLATITYRPYIFNVDEDVSIRETNYRRYTFRDIQVLDERIKNLEYYTQLSLLESETATMTIRDTTGLDRFKNGFVVDNFASLATSDTLHPDYRVSMDFAAGELRPGHYTTQVPLVYGTDSQNVKISGDIVTLPYTDSLLIEQSYASAVENVNPFNVFTYVGDLKLYPESDNWVDTKTLSPLKGPTVEGNFLTTVREYNADQNGFSPIHWNAWQTTWTGTSTSVSSVRESTGKKSSRIRETTTTTTTTKQARTGIRYRVLPIIEEQSLGSRVVSVEHINFMRSRNIEFTVKKVKPRTKFYAFFDGIALPTANVTPKIIGLVKDPATDAKTNSIPFQIGETVYVKDANGQFRFKARAVTPNEGYNINPLDGSDISTISDYKSNLNYINIDTKALADQAKGAFFGSPKLNDYIVGETSGAIAKVSDKSLISDTAGNLRGAFFLDDPNVDGNLKFKTGTRLFRLTDQSDDTRVQGVSDSSAEAEFVSSGILQTQQETIISVRNAQVTSEELREERTLVSTSSSTRYVDPLAQTFLVDTAGLEGGVFLSKVDIFFFTKDSEIPVSLDIRTVVNGTPTQLILPFSKVVKQPNEVFTSDNASTPTTFVFESPVYIPYRSEHAIVLTSDSNQYKVFISVLGQDAVDAAHAGEKISEQPYIGVLFKSQNASTWTPDQYQDLMFKIYRAAFVLPTTASPSRLILNNAQLGESNGGFLRLLPNTFQLTSGSDEIRVFHSNHGMQSNLNYVSVSGVISEVADTQINMAGGFGTTASQLTVDNAADLHTTIGGSAVSSANPGFLRILGTSEDGSGDEIIAYESIAGNVVNVVGHSVGTVTGRNWSATGGSGSSIGKSHADDTVVQCYNLAGIPLTLINTTHNSSTGGLLTVNSPHSYKLKITGKTAGKSISSGGPNIRVSQNIPWDVLTPQVQSQVQPQTSIVSRVLATSGTSSGPFPSGASAETSFVKDTTYSDVTLGEINYFAATKVIASEINEINNMNSQKSFTMEIDMNSEVDNLSPVIDLEKCSIITTANVINNITPSKQIGGECVANYITRVARLDKSSTGLRVMLAANTFTPSNIVLMYKLVPVGYGGNLDDLDFEFFNVDGRPDSGQIIAQNNPDIFTDFEYTLEDVSSFDAFQIKISLVGYYQPYIPRVKDLRIIALA